MCVDLHVSVSVCVCECLSVCDCVFVSLCVYVSVYACLYQDVYDILLVCVWVLVCAVCLCVHLWLLEARLECGSPFPPRLM